MFDAGKAVGAGNVGILFSSGVLVEGLCSRRVKDVNYPIRCSEMAAQANSEI